MLKLILDGEELTTIDRFTYVTNDGSMVVDVSARMSKA